MALIFPVAILMVGAILGLISLVVKPFRAYSLRTFAATIGFLLFAFVGLGMFGVVVVESSSAIKTSLSVLVAFASGAFGALLAILFIMRFVEHKDFGQIREGVKQNV